MMTAQEARARGLGGMRGCMVGLALVAPFWCCVARVALWLVLR